MYVLIDPPPLPSIVGSPAEEGAARRRPPENLRWPPNQGLPPLSRMYVCTYLRSPMSHPHHVAISPFETKRQSKKALPAIATRGKFTISVTRNCTVSFVLNSGP